MEMIAKSKGSMPMMEAECSRLDRLFDEHPIERTLEFGSGKSTGFLFRRLRAGFGREVISIESHPQFGCVLPENPHGFRSVVCPLLQWTPEDMEAIIEDRKYSTEFAKSFDPLSVPPANRYRTRGVFYDLTPAIDAELLRVPFDLVVLDGWNGDGRNIGLAALAEADLIAPGGLLWLHDANPGDEHRYFATAERLFRITDVERFHMTALLTIYGVKEESWNGDHSSNT